MQIKYHRDHGSELSLTVCSLQYFPTAVIERNQSNKYGKSPILPALNPFAHLPLMEFCAFGVRTHIADAAIMRRFLAARFCAGALFKCAGKISQGSRSELSFKVCSLQYFPAAVIERNQSNKYGKSTILPALNPFVHLPLMEFCAYGVRTHIADAAK